MRGEALWPGKSDVDQLYLIRKTLGDLIPRHLQIFKSNDFFSGVAIPELQATEGLINKIPKHIEESGVDFLKKCLDKDPQKRPASEQLLRHPYFNNVKIPELEVEEAQLKYRQRSKNGQSILPHLSHGITATPEIRSVQLHSRSKASNNNSYNEVPNKSRFEHLPNI
ncbi:cyclin-dependent kinase-like 1 [Dinothrombium tinctorium]|uniref:Cyclin-dependent kinase-like 1 n=1 Tax=Dinothrombium tinctorium TaxID=1965070 RepID=A0A3S3P671_9ACAR|nr:cyclin-dependent kinase-like 1 [Dinothrombium tinctorium]RWS11406.1 cyclin-dependent kinase-like 1 [Dinothrombium tinctorium]RWS11507.1 cyclin-dependent kinase-like 1 [Dinothrombium tinctorium]RWS13021.1 cyclin-dependent kinase-like 1 [Dinothrombium tinctorium]